MLLNILFGCDSAPLSPPEVSKNKESTAAGSVGANSGIGVAATMIRFDDVAADVGIEFTARTGQESQLYTILESLGSGIAFCDYDGDSQPDLAAPGGGTFDAMGFPLGQPFALFRQINPSRFVQSAGYAGIKDPPFYSHGIAVADWDNDGFCDFLITGFYGRTMLHNEGDGTFSSVAWGLPPESPVWSTSAAFLDLENDGDLDCYIVNYVDLKPGEQHKCVVKGHRDVCPPGNYAAVSDQLLVNNGDTTFSDVSRSVGLVDGGKGLAVITGDIDHDGDCDLYVANDTTANLLYINDGTGQLVEQGLISGSALGFTAEAEGSMGVEFADFNSDGRTDIWVSNYENQSFALYECRGVNIFQHVSMVRGITAVGQLFVGFGTAAFDADLDGDDDIFATNGHVMYHSASSPRKQTPLIFENQGGKFFRNVAGHAGTYTSSPHEGRGLTIGDFDEDGRVDVAISHANERLSLLRNVCLAEHESLALRLVGRTTNRDAVGAVIRILDSSDSQVQRIDLRTNGGSYLSTRNTVLTYCTQGDKQTVNQRHPGRIEIQWPGGRRTLHEFSLQRMQTIVEPIATNTAVE